MLRPNSEYHVAVTTQETSQPTTVTVEVSGKQHGGGMFEASQTVSVEPYTTHIVKLEVCVAHFSYSGIKCKEISPFFIAY